MSRMPAVKNVGEPCAGEPHARFEVAAGGNQTSRASTCRAVQAPPVDPPVWVSSPTKHGCDAEQTASDRAKAGARSTLTRVATVSVMQSISSVRRSRLCLLANSEPSRRPPPPRPLIAPDLPVR